MPIIYEPRGKAREYSELSVNLFTGCVHSCAYCYCPSILRKSLDNWVKEVHVRDNILKKLEGECKRATQDLKNKELLLSFMTDTYQTDEYADITRQALELFDYHGFKKINVLTKSGYRVVRDFDLFVKNPGWKFGSTIIFKDETYRRKWERGAPSISSRYNAINLAKEAGIYCWVSIEPVIVPEESLKVIDDLKGVVDFFKIGKLNHFKEIEATIDWRLFLANVRQELKGHNYMIKKDLLKYE